MNITNQYSDRCWALKYQTEPYAYRHYLSAKCVPTRPNWVKLSRTENKKRIGKAKPEHTRINLTALS